MTDDRVIEYLRSRGQAQPPVELVPSVMAAVDAAPSLRSRFAAYLPAAAVAGAVAIVAIVALLLGQSPNVGPGPSPSRAPTPHPASIEELQAAVTAATERLAEAPGVQGTQTSTIEEYLASAVWFDWRPNGDQLAISRTDIDVSVPWWTDPDGEPLRVGERIETQISVLAGDEFYRTEEGAWIVSDRSDAPPVLAYGIGLFSGEIPVARLFGEAGDMVVSRREMEDGGELWIVEGRQDGGTAISVWRIRPDGSLASWARKGTDVTLLPDLGPTSGSSGFTIEFTPVEDPEPIPAPDPDAAPDTADFGLPADFPLAAPEAARLRTMTDEQVAADLASDPESAEAQYVTFIMGEGGLNPPTGVTARNLLIFAYEECAGLSPPPPPQWRRERMGQPVGFENFIHTARGFAQRLICPGEP